MWSVIDTETDHDGRFRLGVVLDDDDRVRVTQNADEMRSWVLDRERVVWGHNISYDLGVLWRGSIGIRTMRGRFRSARHAGVLFLDTLSFFEMPLSELGGLTGVHKAGDGAESLDYATDELAEYCIQDCRATAAGVRAIHAFSDDNGLTRTGTGPGSWARMIWARLEPWTVDYCDDRALFKAKQMPKGVVRGGLVKWTEGTLKNGVKYDIKSAYPWQMWSGEFPDLSRIGSKSGRDVLVQYRDPDRDVLVWGVPEECEAAGARVIRRLKCPAGAWRRPFVSFCEHMMETRNKYREADDKAGAYLAKRVANSLSGIMGARTMSAFTRNGIVTGGATVDALPGTRSAWAALITSRQRARLRRAWKTAVLPCYSDTDSLVAKRFTPDREGIELFGRWELETEFDRAVVLGPKMYATFSAAGNSGHVKGIPKRMAVETIDRLLKGGETVVEWDSPFTYREIPGQAVLWTKRKRDPFRSLRETGRVNPKPIGVENGIEKQGRRANARGVRQDRHPAEGIEAGRR